MISLLASQRLLGHLVPPGSLWQPGEPSGHAERHVKAPLTCCTRVMQAGAETCPLPFSPPSPRANVYFVSSLPKRGI